MDARASFKGYINDESPIFWLASLSLNGVFAASPKCRYIYLLFFELTNYIFARIWNFETLATGTFWACKFTEAIGIKI